MSFKITHPEGGTRDASGMHFEDGVAEVENLDKAAAAVLKDHGYKIEGKASAPAADIPEGEPSEKWTVKQLKAYAEQSSIALGDAKKADQILAVILEAKAAPADGDEQTPPDGEADATEPGTAPAE